MPYSRRKIRSSENIQSTKRSFPFLRKNGKISKPLEEIKEDYKILKSEIRTLRKLKHKHIAHYYDVEISKDETGTPTGLKNKNFGQVDFVFRSRYHPRVYSWRLNSVASK